MSQITTHPKWVSRKATKTTGDNLIMLTAHFDAGDLTSADDGTNWVNGEHVGLFEIPFGSIVHYCHAKVSVAAGGASTADIGVLGFTSFVDGVFTDNASTGNDPDGLFDAIDLNAATAQVGAGLLLGRPLDATIFTDAACLNKPLYITMEGATVSTTNPALVVLDISILVQTP